VVRLYDLAFRVMGGAAPAASTPAPKPAAPTAPAKKPTP
jgi:hypothetical protein